MDGQTTFVEVPDVRGYNLYSEESVVVRILGESGLDAGGFSEDDSNREEGIIVRQNPGPGSMVPRGSAVDLIVSTGQYTLVTVPDLTGWNLYEEEDEILEILEESGLSEGNVYEESSSLDEGTIFGQKPAAGSRVSRGSAVDLRVAEEEGWPWWPIIVIGGVALGGGYTAYRVFRPSISFKPEITPGKQVIEPCNSVLCEDEITLRPVRDAGKQVIEDEASVVMEDKTKGGDEE
ncbi:PASTA domain-containing protein [Methanogenium organophilum]|uniref:PASTA domain-containing protein n=1 Tax=Methanogenium organophilum TaxID=2199 RepID=A0A9X9S6D9_METOG|nr:PASTA domain-containing protein [Methanogenium organophilum]